MLPSVLHFDVWNNEVKGNKKEERNFDKYQTVMARR